MAASFVTLTREHRAEIREKNSRFIATAIPARDEMEARAGIEKGRSEFPDATHHCWAYALQAGRAAPLERRPDPGGRGGRAGPPLLQAARRAGGWGVVFGAARGV